MVFDVVSRLLFPTPPPSYCPDSFPGELIWVPKNLQPESAAYEDFVPMLLFESPSSRFIFVYFHSNGEDLGWCHGFCQRMNTHLQVHVLAVEYPGYGVCPSPNERCDEQGVRENAETAMRFVTEVLQWPLDGVILLGRSIGTGPAICLATHYTVAGVILVSPILSLKDICWDVFGPFSYIVEERFPNKERVPLIKAPVMILHGQSDRIVPLRHGVELYGLCNCRKMLVCPKKMDHNTSLFNHPSMFVVPVLQFLGIPDYCFEELQVPAWAYEKRRSPAAALRALPAPAAGLGPMRFLPEATDRSVHAVRPPDSAESSPRSECLVEEDALSEPRDLDIDVVVNDGALLDRSCANSEASDKIRWHLKLDDDADEISATLQSQDTTASNSQSSRRFSELYAFEVPLSPRVSFQRPGGQEPVDCGCSQALPRCYLGRKHAARSSRWDTGLGY